MGMYASGKSKQTVNMTAQPSKVRILPHPPNYAAVAQLVELRIENPRVTGSIPVRSTKFISGTIFYKGGAITLLAHVFD
jgi:hypothetical protein